MRRSKIDAAIVARMGVMLTTCCGAAPSSNRPGGEGSAIAFVPVQCLSNVVRRGIAPTTQCDHIAAYWGQCIEQDVSDKHRELLGAVITVPDEIAQPLHEAWRMVLNARQCIAKIKGKFGQEVRPQFLAEVLGEAPERINAYGDGSLKCPATQWWVLGGFGVWWLGATPDQAFKVTMPDEQPMHVEDKDIGIGMWNCMQGQFGSSTRMDLGSWIMTMVRSVPAHMDMDSESM